MLDTNSVVQLFDSAVRLARDENPANPMASAEESFVAVLQRHPTSHTSGQYQQHGITGFGWAARRDVLERHGLYEHCLAGSADHLMAHAFCGDVVSPCIQRTFQGNTRHQQNSRPGPAASRQM